MKNKKGFFLAETIAVIAVVAVVLVSVFKIFSSVYLNYRQSEKYNTVGAINALANIQKYYNSVEIIDTSSVNEGTPYIELTNYSRYNSEFYTRLKQEYNVTNVYLVDLDNVESHLNEMPINLRRYIKTLINKEGIALIVVVNNDEFSYLKLKPLRGKICTFDGTLTQGAEFTDGQYTYRYMQESSATGWTSIPNDGWGVVLTDKNSTAPITTKMCAYINNKPIVSTRAMFYQSKAISINLSGFDTSNVVNMRGMFKDCEATRINLDNIDTSNVTDMMNMFQNIKVTTLDLSAIDTRNVITMQGMFRDNTTITTLDLSGFDTSKVTDMNSMFRATAITILDLSSFDTSKVTDMITMFRDASITTLDLSSFDMSNVSSTNGMFRDSTITTGYAKTQADADILNASTYKPSTLTFVPKWNKTFTYYAGAQTFTAGKSGYYKVELWGAQGGYYEGYSDRAKGGYTSGYIYMNAGETYYVYVGEAGNNERTSKFNGGAPGGLPAGSLSGGGATDIRYFGNTTPTSSQLAWNSPVGLNSRIMVAAGGGGTGIGSYNSAGGNSAGGGLIGNSGGYYSGHGDQSAYGTGGTQVLGGRAGSNIYNATGTNNAGTFGIGGSSESTSSQKGSGGGGGGYYGGGAGGGTQSGGSGNGAGGGSSFISGYAGVDVITSSSNSAHTHGTKHYSGKYFINTTMIAGNNSGDGRAVITYVGDIVPKTNTKLNNVRYIKDCINGSSVNSGNHWVEIQAIKDGTNVAKDKAVTGTNSQANTTTYAYSNVVDGQIFNITGNSGFGYTTSTGLQCITVNLGSTYDLDELVVWHYYPDNRTYSSNTTTVSSDNTEWTIIFNTSIAETSQGRRVTAWD